MKTFSAAIVTLLLLTGHVVAEGIDNDFVNEQPFPDQQGDWAYARTLKNGACTDATAGVLRTKFDRNFDNGMKGQFVTWRDGGIAKGPSATAEYCNGEGSIGVFAGAEIARIGGTNGWVQGQLAVDSRTGLRFGSHNEIKVLGTGIEAGKEGIGLSIFGSGFKVKFW